MNITCLDIETTGLDKSYDRIVQLSLQNFDAKTFELKEKANWYISPSGIWFMSPDAQKVHGISKEFIREHGVPLNSIYNQWKSLIKDHIILTYNGTKFDICMIQKEFDNAGLDTEFDKCMFIDALEIERKLNKQERNKLGEVYERYFGHPFEGAHDASCDILATIDVYKKQMESIKDQPHRSKVVAETNLKTTRNMGLAPDGSLYRDESGYLKFRFGKHKNMPVLEVCKNDPSYIKWLWKENAICKIAQNTIKKEWYNNRT